MINYSMNGWGIIVHKEKRDAAKVTILDEVMGMQVIYYTSLQTILPIGSLIQYTIKKRSQTIFIESIKLEDIPFSIAKNDIYFLHHVLELVYFFVPVGSCTQGLFEHLHLLYLLPDESSYSVVYWKKLFLCKLIFIIGLYPEKFYPLLKHINQQMIMPVDIGNSEFLHLSQAVIDEMITESVKSHPAFLKLKTTYFFDNYRKL